MHTRIWSVVLYLFSLSASAAPPEDALLVVSTDPAVSLELVDDVTEAACFALGQEGALHCLPKEKIQGLIGYQGPRKPGNCLFNSECLRLVHTDIKTRVFVLVRVSKEGDRYAIIVNRLATDTTSDVIIQGNAPLNASDLIQKIRTLVVESLKDPEATVIISVNEADALVTIDDKAVGTGSSAHPVKPGTHRIRVSKDGFIPFEIVLQCEANNRCVVSAILVKEPTVVVPKISQPIEEAAPVPNSVRTALLTVGWTTAGIGAVLTIVGAVYGSSAQQLQHDLENGCVTQPCSLTVAEAREIQEEGETATAVFNYVGIPGMVLFVGGMAVAIAGHFQPTVVTKEAISVGVAPYVGRSGSFGIHTHFRF